ncbi:hypothetical protein AAW50_01085 [Mycoplasmopsis canis]|uniref:hypothetical protein n=1 Tax=Mycoplasmopsis canis TaxID=29555 RepID=UPI0006247081|nr:hypothetical protein [Mycoplasmopsis canis]AKF41033.1 hypothetical protein AAW50_01085 [Mycoplasmopsis canis]
MRFNSQAIKQYQKLKERECFTCRKTTYYKKNLKTFKAEFLGKQHNKVFCSNDCLKEWKTLETFFAGLELKIKNLKAIKNEK